MNEILNMQTSGNWYALYTRPRWEKKVASLLSRKEIEAYCPINQVTRRWSDRRKVVHEPLFTCYVFVRIEPSELWRARSVDGVLSIVHWLGKPAKIPDEEIDYVKRFLNDYSSVKLEKVSVDLDDKVRILNGPMMMMEGNVVEIRYKTVKVVLPSLGYTMVAEIDKSNVEVITMLSDNVALTGKSTNARSGLRGEDSIN
jgi:transcription antitermination factor NusG